MRFSAIITALLASLPTLSPGCSCGPVPNQTQVPNAATQQSQAPSASVASSAEPAPLTATNNSFRFEPLLNDPRLREVTATLSADDAAGAAAAMERAIATHATGLNAVEKARWSYQLGRLHRLAHADNKAARAFVDASSTEWPLTHYATLAAAQSFSRAGKHDEAIRLASSIPSGQPYSAAARLAAAEAFEAKSDLTQAMPLWRQYLASASKPPRWTEISLKLARAILNSSPDEALAEEALLIARRVAVEAPSGVHAERAEHIEAEALVKIQPPKRDQLATRSKADEVTRWGAMVDVNRAIEAERGLSDVERNLTEQEKRSELGCKVALLLASARVKKKDKVGAADTYTDAISRCQGDALITALYNGGKASVTAGRPAEARTRFERVEKEGPKHRLADDARVRGADAALSMGDEQRFSQMLERLADDYPEGDMVADGLFKLAWRAIDRDEWGAAIAPLEKAIKARPNERTYYAAGRAQYYHARALEKMGQQAKAKEELRQVVRNFPLAYTMSLAHARLAESDPKDAQKVLEEAKQSANSVSFTLPDREVFRTPAMPRVVELLKQGETDLAKAEITALGLTGNDAPNDALWAAAIMYNRAGAIAQAHAVPRGRVSDWLAHYPESTWREAWEVAFPRPYFDLVKRESKTTNVPIPLIYAIMREESAFDPAVVSHAKAIGLMQMIIPTAKTMSKGTPYTASEDSLKNPSVNIPLGTKFLSTLRHQFAGCPLLAIPSYNAGPGKTLKWLKARPNDDLDVFIERIPYEETRNYFKRVMASMAAYAYLYDPSTLDEVIRAPSKLGCAPGSPAGPPAEQDSFAELSLE